MAYRRFEMYGIRQIVNDSSWERDGVTLQVRFCEGGTLYRVTGRLAATLPIKHGRW